MMARALFSWTAVNNIIVMPLPILSTSYEPAPADLLRHYLRCRLHWVRHLSDDETVLDVGTAFTNPQLAAIGDANHIRDVSAPPGESPANVVKMVDDHFDARGVRCAYYVMNPSTPAEQNGALIEHLISTGYTPATRQVLMLGKFAGAAPRAQADLKLIPTRASYRHFHELAERHASEIGAPQLTQAWEAHLDDPHYDALLALENGATIAHGGVLAIGEMGYLAQIYVAPARRRQGIGTLILSRLMEISARSLFKSIYVDLDSSNPAAESLLKKFGFRAIGQSTIYRRVE
jgi:GNAT superfamily N-acetyltransferase